MTGPPRVVLADDFALLRAGLARLLTDAGLQVVGQADDVASLHRAVDQGVPDVAVIDIRMPPTHTLEGLRAAHEIRLRHPRIGLLILSQYLETRHALELVQSASAGVGYLLKQRVAEPGSFLAAVRDVAAGGTAIDPEVVAVLLGRSRRRDPLAELTAREREVLALMAEGRSNATIADALVLSPKTVESHINRVFTKLGLQPQDHRHRRVAAVLSYLRATQG